MLQRGLARTHSCIYHVGSLPTIFRDVSFGRETHPIPVVNAIDDEQYPKDFLYVMENVETSPMNVNRVVTSLQVRHEMCYNF